jgi:hypothetical protein
MDVRSTYGIRVVNQGVDETDDGEVGAFIKFLNEG